MSAARDPYLELPLHGLRGAVACNATGLWPLVRIGEQGMPDSAELLALLQRALAQTRRLPL